MIKTMKERWEASHCDKCDSMYKGEVCPICRGMENRIAFEIRKIENPVIPKKKPEGTADERQKGLTHSQIAKHRCEILKELRAGATGYQRGHRHKQPWGMHIIQG